MPTSKRTAKPSRTRKRQTTRSPRRTPKRPMGPASAWTVPLDDNLTVEGKGNAVSWGWRGSQDSRPNDDEAVAFALTRLHDLEQKAYDGARQLKREGAKEYSAAQRREIETDRRNARRDADRLRRFVRIMERRP